MIKYLKFYFEPKHKELTPLALEAWRNYIKGKKRIYNMDVCTNYQRRFISEYRHTYALIQLAKIKQQ
jgi:hypothetical protein